MNSLSVMLIPTVTEYLLLPAGMVNWVFPYAPPLTVDEYSEFVIGGLLVQNDKLPLLDFSFHTRNNNDYERGDSTDRIVLVSALSTKSRFRRFAILSHGAPETLTIKPNDIKTLAAGNHRYIAQYVSLADRKENKQIAIPNLPILETELVMS